MAKQAFGCLALFLFAGFTSFADNPAYQNNFELRQSRKMGVGASFGGPLGVFGLFTELNLNRNNGAVAGIGAGSGYNSFVLAWKNSLEGSYLNPYTQVGYSRWFGTGTAGDPTESTILNQVLESSEKADGKFGKDFLVGSLGVQYTQLKGETRGLSFFMQIDLMFAFSNGHTIPAGTAGSIFYF